MNEDKSYEFSKPGFLKVAKMAAEDNPDNYALAEKLAEDCTGTKGVDRCALGLTIIDCFRKAAAARNTTYDGM